MDRGQEAQGILQAAPSQDETKGAASHLAVPRRSRVMAAASGEAEASVAAVTRRDEVMARAARGQLNANANRVQVSVPDFLAILDIVKPKDGEVFVDLGSGLGKAVLASACGFPEFSEVPVGSAVSVGAVPGGSTPVHLLLHLSLDYFVFSRPWALISSLDAYSALYRADARPQLGLQRVVTSGRSDRCVAYWSRLLGAYNRSPEG